MNKVFSLFLILVVIHQGRAQNLIRNGDFEIKKSTTSANKPNEDDQLAKTKYWKRLRNTGLTIGSISKATSPDWYSIEFGKFHGLYAVSSGADYEMGNVINPQNGSNHHAGFASCEGFFQELSQTIPKNSFVKISYWYSPRSYGANTEIQTYLFVNKPNTMNTCSSPGFDASTIVLTHKVNSSGSAPEDVPGAWRYFESNWINTGGTQEYNWFAMKGQNTSGVFEDPDYLYVDDIIVQARGDCCLDFKLYEHNDDLPTLTHVEDFIRAGNDAGIPAISGDVSVLNGQNVTFKAGDFIDLLVGFEAEPGSNFTAEIEACTPDTKSSGGPITIDNYPNFFSPNGDGIRDVLLISAKNAQEFSFLAVNRSGQLIINVSGTITSDPFIVWTGFCVVCGNNTFCNDEAFTVLRLSNCTGSIVATRTILTLCGGNKTSSPGVDSISTSPGFNMDSLMEIFLGNAVIVEPVLTDVATYTEEGAHSEINIRVYPNPNSGQFTLDIDLLEATELIIKLYQVSGQLISSERIGSVIDNYTQQIDLSKQSRGLYYLVIQTDDNIVTRKIVYH